jgi:hypothetical protein
MMLAKDPGITFERLQLFFSQCLRELGEQWRRMCQVPCILLSLAPRTVRAGVCRGRWRASHSAVSICVSLLC